MATTKLLGLDPKTYEHPFDKAALSALKKLPLFADVLNFFLSWSTIKWRIINLKGSNFHVTPASCPELYNIVKDTADTIDVNYFPQIYTEWGHFINAYTTGYKDETLLVLYSGAVDLMTETELKFIIGHEMGHIKSEHVIYHVMAQVFTQLIAQMSIAGNLLTPIQVALMYWSRMSEFTADRAGLLACQDEDAAIDSVIKMAGVPQKYFGKVDRNVFLEQAKEFESLLTGAENVMKNISVLDDSHPWTILRAAELIKWIDSGEYRRILDQNAAVICKVCGSNVKKDSEICPICNSADYL